MVLHPDKTKFMLFSRTGGEQDLNIFCNNNNSDQNLAENISVISRVTANDELPAIKFSGVFFYPNLNFNPLDTGELFCLQIWYNLDML